MTTKSIVRLLILAIVLTGVPAAASAGVLLKLGDILVAEPGTDSISVVDASTGAKTMISQGGLLSPAHKTVGVALARDGDVIVVHRQAGLIRINPATGAQSIHSSGGLFRDPWAIAIDKVTGHIYVADSGYDNDRPEINGAGKIIRVHPTSGAQELIAQGSPCSVFPSNAACQNTTSAGSYLAHPYGIAIDASSNPATLVVADMSSFNGKGAIIRIQAVVGGAQTLLWGPSSASPPPRIAQSAPLGCPMGVAVEPNGNILTALFTYPVPPTPQVPPPAGTFYGCAPPGIYRLNLTSNTQSVVNANAPLWQASHAYAVGNLVRDPTLERIHRVVTAGISQATDPSWSGTAGSTTTDGSVVWQNIGLGANWLIPFGLAVEPAPTPSDPSHYNLIVVDEGYSMVLRLGTDGHFMSAPLAFDLSNSPAVNVITFTPSGGFKDPAASPPARFNGQPAGVLPAGTTQVTLGLTTDEDATCRYSAQAGVAYGSMTNTFATTGSTTHSSVVSGLSGGNAYQFYVRCADTAGNANPDDFVLAFSIPDPSPTLSNGQPGGVLLAGTTQVSMGLTTDELATCRYSAQAGVAYASMTNTFATTGSTTHSTVVSGLSNGNAYQFYVRCADTAGNANAEDFVLAFSVASPSSTISNFAGVESPLSEGGKWDKPGAWASLQKNNGAYAIGLNAQARLVTPAMGPNQFAEITYDQNPGAASWVGVTTRTQGAGNGSGYLAIAYAGEVRLYRTDDTGSVSFTMLASASAPIGNAPRRLRLESEGNTHRVYFNGTLMLTHSATGTIYSSGQPGIAASVFGGPQVKILSFEGRNLGPGDGVPPLRFNEHPATTLPAGTTQVTMGLTTDEAATCRYSPQAGVAYGSMTNTFATTGSTSHSSIVSGLSNGNAYQFYVRCADSAGNANPEDLVLAFSIASPSATISNFAGVESPLSEGSAWDAPGAWASLQKNNGAYAVGLNAQARLVTPAVGPNQYAQITYDQNPGAASWVGVTTRTQNAGNGSGYLAIAYGGEVRLYRTDDTGSVSFTMLASASAPIGNAPRRLRLESEGNTHRVYFNGTLMLTHSATGTIYSSGQPGIAASVFGGPQVKILSFEGGAL